MTLKEFVKLDSSQIRRDNELMQLFVNFYEAAFSVSPKCVGCAFKSGFKNLKKYANNTNKKLIFDKNNFRMENKTFKVKPKYRTDILTFVKNGKTHRKYGHNLTEDFAIELVKAGKTEVFEVLPNFKENSIKIDNSINYEGDLINHDGIVSKLKVEDGMVTELEMNSHKDYFSMDYRNTVLPLYSEIKERTGLKAESRSKTDIINFIIEHEG